MLTLPFRQIANVEHMLDQYLIEDLVLVFCMQSEDQCLLVYNRSSLPSLQHDGWNSICLDDLTPEDYLSFNGPVIGFSALDVVFPDIPTHGVNFYHIYQIFEHKERLPQYQQTAYHLAEWLLEKKERFTGREQRGYGKIIELALPHLLKNQALENLVAVLPHSNFSVFLQNGPQSMQRIYIEDLDQLKVLDEKRWIITFEEILTLHPTSNWNQAYWFDLRLVFQQMQESNTLRQTCSGLARYYWQEWQNTQIDIFKNFAYTFAAESWVMEKEAEDLIALLPHNDFERFVGKGDAIRVDRIHQINQDLESNGQRIFLMDLAEPDRLRQKIKDYQGPPISFPILAPLLNRLVNEPVLNLASVLYHARRSSELARTFGLISSDLLKFTQFPHTAASPEQITDLAQRASQIYCLSSPWIPLWRARYKHLITLAYSYLIECLTNQELSARERGLSEYYRALKEWHGCYLSQDIPHSLAAVQNACRDFMATAQMNSDLQNKQKIVGKLESITNRLLRPDVDSSMPVKGYLPSHFKVVDYLRQIVQQSEPVSVFSPTFDDLLYAYAKLHARWRDLQHSSSGKPTNDRDLKRLKSDYTILPKMAFAPAHELRLLQWACQRDLAEIESWSQVLHLGPSLEILVLNHQMIIGKQELVFVELINAGAAAAHDFELSLMPSQQFEILSHVEPLMLATLEAGQSLRLEWSVRTANSPVNLNFSYRFREPDGKIQSGEITTAPIEAILARSAGISPSGGNHFQAGAPVSGYRFYGRAEELKEILQILLGETSQPILLRGSRRIGKSSILHQLEYILTTEGEVRSLGYTLDEERELMSIRPVITSFHEIHSEQFISGWLGGLFKEICRLVNEPYDSQAIKEDFLIDPIREFRYYLQRLFRNRSDVRLLVMIDEWDEQRHLGKLGNNLRNIMQLSGQEGREGRMNWIVSSTWVLQADAGKYGSPFYGQCMSVELKKLRWNSAAKMVRDLSNRAGVDWQGETRVTLLDQTGCRPYLTQLICQQVITELYDHPSTFVDSNVLSRVIGKFLSTPQASGQTLGFLWEKDPLSNINAGEARLHWLGRLILLEMDQSLIELTSQQIKEHIWDILSTRGLLVQEKSFASFFNEEFAEQILELEYIFDIIQVESQHLLFSIPLVKRWFHQMLQQYSDPFLHACQGMMQEYSQWKGDMSGKEKKK
jgi:hypothetical protein